MKSLFFIVSIVFFSSITIAQTPSTPLSSPPIFHLQESPTTPVDSSQKPATKQVTQPVGKGSDLWEWTPYAKYHDTIVEVSTEHGSGTCLLYTSPSPRDRQKSRMPSSA